MAYFEYVVAYALMFVVLLPVIFILFKINRVKFTMKRYFWEYCMIVVVVAILQLTGFIN